MFDTDRERLRAIKTFPSLVKYLRDELDWPIESEDFEDLTFDYEPEELGIDPKTAAKIEQIKQLRPLVTNQPWGIFFIKFEPKRLPVVALRRILSRLVIKKRSSAKKSEQASWALHDLLFISNYGEGDQRQMTFAHFAEEEGPSTLPTLRVLGWDDADTALHIDHVHQELKEKLRWPHDETDLTHWRDKWSSAFALRHREVISTSKDLAIRLADLARRIRRRANHVLAIETERGPLRKLHKAFQEALIHDLTEDDFADMYAQTITYGLFSAAISRTAPDLGTAVMPENLADMVPITNPFLKEMLATFLTAGGRKAKMDFDELGIQEVVNLLNSPDTHMDAILWDFGNLTPQEDPVIHFYELFLAQYDKKKKIRRGVFYTPRPVVSYIVRSVDELLRTEFGLADGLADTATWGEMKKRFDCSPGFRPAVAQEQARMPAPQELVESSDPPLTAGSCILRRPDIARIVQDALLHFEGQRYHLCAWCIMPNHVHVVLQPLAGHELQDILHSWKSFTATKINRLLHRQGALWERESFNHLIRRAEHVERFVYYTEHNPVAAGFTAAPKDWPFSSCGADLSTCGAGFQPAPLEFVDPRKTPFVEPRSRGELPHLQKEGGTYFITWCLLDATCDAGFQPAGPEPSEPCDVALQPGGSELSQPCGAGFQPAATPEVASAAAGEKGIGAGKMPAPQFHIPDGVKPTDPFVTILDPACGTGTFLVEAIDVIHRTMTEKWKAQGHGENNIQALWNDYVPKHLLPRLHGYELLMAPYAIAHMKLPLKLKETGFTAWDKLGDDTRVRIYLTNSLEPPSDLADPKLADLFGPLAREAQEVNDIKRNKRFTIVIGNPPYSLWSQNLTEQARAIVEPYRYVDGEPIKERGALQFEKILQDDYIKFFRFSQAQIDASQCGVLGLITNHSFTDNPTLRGMRRSLLSSFHRIHCFNLHGNSSKKERCPDGSADKNVFDIKQGVAIFFGVEAKGAEGATYVCADLWGTQEAKYLMLGHATLESTCYQVFDPKPPSYLFKARDSRVAEECERGWKLPDIFEQGSMGIVTARDHVSISFDEAPLLATATEFRDSPLSDEAVCEKLRIPPKKGWDAAKARTLIRQQKNLRDFVKVIGYRPFDHRRIFYHRSLVWGMSWPTMQHVLDKDNVGLSTTSAPSQLLLTLGYCCWYNP